MPKRPTLDHLHPPPPHDQRAALVKNAPIDRCAAGRRRGRVRRALLERLKSDGFFTFDHTALTTAKDFRVVNDAMKHVSLKSSPAPTPRLTLWVPALIAVALSLFWLGLLALTGL
jgi:hypothetical protein